MLKKGEGEVNQGYIRDGLREESAKEGRRWSKLRIYKERMER